MMSTRLVTVLLTSLACSASFAQDAFVAFESVQFRPMALSQSGKHLFVVNTPDNRLEIFDLTSELPRLVESVPVGLEPVAVAARKPNEVWVVNHLSDSVSVIELGYPYRARVKRTLHVGDEPRDIVFGGTSNSLAFISTAHRGQNSPYTDPGNPGELTTSGIGRTDVWVFDTNNLGAGAGGTALDVMTFFGDSAGPLARSADGSRIYVGVFKSGNATTTLAEQLVCNGGANAAPCAPSAGEAVAPGGLPAPNSDVNGTPAREAGLIVRNRGNGWRDELGRDWSSMVRFDLPDLDVFRIDIQSNVPQASAAYAGVGTVLFGMAVNPSNGRLFVSNTEARNEIRFGGTRSGWFSNLSTVNGKFVQSRITVIDPASATVTPRHLNKHIDYSVVPSPSGVKERSLATPMGLTFNADGTKLYVAAMGSDRIGVFDTAQLESDSFAPSAAAQIPVSGGGPTGVVLDPARDRLYALTRFDNAVSVIALGSGTEIAHLPMPNPEPATLRNGRRFLYDARLTSSNGEASCAGCHVGGDKDELAWDLGDPLGSVVANPNPFIARPGVAPPPVFHSMKGPMTTQTLRGMNNHGPMHWRGDKSGALDAGGSAFDEAAAFRQFNEAFVSLQGRESELSSTEMQTFTEFALQLTPPPNPVRNLDDSLTPMQLAGRNDYFNQRLNGFGATCAICHALNPDAGFFGTDGRSSVALAPNSPAQIDFKSPHMRNMYEKVGMFGMPANIAVNTGNNGHTGAQIRGFGFMHDGSFDTLNRRMQLRVLQFPGGDTQRSNIEQFLFAFDSNLKPVVGQQVTLGPTSDSAARTRAQLLIDRALAGDADLAVKARLWQQWAGWLLQSDGRFRPNISGAPLWTAEQLLTLANWEGSELTFTAVPPGSGYRIGLDRDEDGILDGNE